VPHRPFALRATAVVAIFSVAVLASALGPAVQEPPPIAFGWTVLFHVERAALLLGTVGGSLLVLWRATERRYPIRFAQIEYEPRKVDDEIWAAIGRIDKHICLVRDHLADERQRRGERKTAVEATNEQA
jgi:hypothetical protein